MVRRFPTHLVWALLLSWAGASPAFAQGATPKSEPLGIGEKVAFDMRRTSDYFNTLTAFEAVTTSELTLEKSDGHAAKTSEKTTIRQARSPDFLIDYTIHVEAEGDVPRDSGYTAIRKGDRLYFAALGADRYLRRKADKGMIASEYIHLDSMRDYLSLLQAGSTFGIAKDKYLGRSVRVYRVLSSIPLDQNPFYKGDPILKSKQTGEIWIDEDTGLVLKMEILLQREVAGKDGGSVTITQGSTFRVAKLGDVGEISAPKKYYDVGKDVPADPVEIPIMQDPR